MKLLYFATPELTNKISEAVESDPPGSKNIHYWMNRLKAKQGNASQVWAVHPEDLLYDARTKRYVKNGINYFRITDQALIDRFNRLPIEEFLRSWNDAEFRRLIARREALLDTRDALDESAPRMEQYEKHLAQIDTELSLFDEWFHANGFAVPSVAHKQRSAPPIPGSAASASVPQTAPSSPAKDMLLSAFVAEHLKAVKTNNSPKTYDIVERAFKHFTSVVGDKMLGKITAQDLEHFKSARAQEVRAASANIEIRAIKAAFNVAVDWGKLDKTPFAKSKQLKIPKKKKVHLTKPEYRQLMAKIGAPWMKDIIEFDVLTGLRLGELMNLKWSDIDITKKTATIQSSDEYQVKGGDMRVVPLNDRALAIVQSKKKINDWVFLTDKGKKVKPDFASKTFKKYAREAKLSEDIHFHSLRHTFATWATEAGIPPHIVKDMMGHSSVAVTEGYIGKDQKAMQSQIGKVTTE